MNIKIAKTLLFLSIIYMIGFYIVKFIFPEYLILAITDPNILNFGKFVESSFVYLNIYYFLSTFVTFYLFASASKGSFKMKWYELLTLVLCVIVNRLVTDYLPDLMVHTSTSLMFFVAWICKGKLKYTAPTFIVHGYLSQFLTTIRGFDTIIYKINVASGFVLSLECFMWLALFGLLFYLLEKKDGKHCSTIYQ